MKRCDIFISQLDGLVVFLAAAHKEVFQTIKQYELTWFPESQDPRLPATFESYQVAVCNGAFLLGYGYFEAFLADLAKEIYLRRPGMLPKDRQVTFKDVLGAGSKADIIRLMIEKEIRNVFSGPIEDVQNYFEQKLQLTWPMQTEILVASRLRNCLMHNGSLVDERLAEVCDRVAGSPIRLEVGEVHSFGIKARNFSRMIWDEAVQRHLRVAGYPAARADRELWVLW